MIEQEEMINLFPEIARAKKLLMTSMDDLRTARLLYKAIDKAYYNVFPDISELEFDKNSVDALKSGFCYTAVEISGRGLKFPTFDIDVQNKLSKSLNIKNLAKAVLEWNIVESGFDNIYEESKEPWAKDGDAYRRPFLRPIGNGKYWPQYEDLDPNFVLLDPDCKKIFSETYSDSAMYWGYTQMPDENQIIDKYGEEVLKHLKVGAWLDTDTFTLKAGKQKDTRYFESVEFEYRPTGEKLVLLGADLFPVFICSPKRKKLPPEVKGLPIKFSKVNKNKNKVGENILSLQNMYFYYDKRGPRNLGLVHKLMPSQFVHENLENSKAEATRLKMLEIPVISGGRQDVVEDSMDTFMENRKSKLFSYVFNPAGIDGVMPTTDMIRFNGLSAEEATQTTNDIYSFSRNVAGVDMARLEARANVALGQTQIIEQEKIDTIEGVIMKNKNSLQHELEFILDFFIQNKGFGLKDVYISYDFITTVKDGEGKDMDISTKREIDLVSAAKELKEERWKVSIASSSIVNRTYTSMLDSWVRILGLIDPSSAPTLYKFILKKIGEAGRFDIPDEVMAGVQNQTAPLGGASQFQPGPADVNNTPPPEQEVNTVSNV